MSFIMIDMLFGATTVDADLPNFTAFVHPWRILGE